MGCGASASPTNEAHELTSRNVDATPVEQFQQDDPDDLTEEDSTTRKPREETLAQSKRDRDNDDSDPDALARSPSPAPSFSDSNRRGNIEEPPNPFAARQTNNNQNEGLIAAS